MRDSTDLLLALEQLLIETLLPAEAQIQSETGAIGHKHLQPAAERIRRFAKTYTQDRNISKDAAFSDDDALAYTLYYTPINAFKIHRFLPYCNPAPEDRPYRVLDFGSGPGSASLAVALEHTGALSLTLVESLDCMQTIGSRLFDELKQQKHLNYTFKKTLQAEEPGTFDLVIAANALNEIPDHQRVAVAEELFTLLAPEGTFLILEPALSHITRKTMALRDALLENDSSRIISYPCPPVKKCPMLEASETDWCHALMEWERPPLIKALDDLTGFNKHRIKYSAFIFQKTGSRFQDVRVVDTPKKNKFEISCTVCAPSYYGPLVRPKKSRSDANRQLEKLKLHDAIKIEPFPEDRVVKKETCITCSDRIA